MDLRKLSTKELQERMRPGSWSEAGFLGPNEDLLQVIADDSKTLARLKVSYEEIAGAIERLIQVGIRNRGSPWPIRVDHFEVIIEQSRGMQPCPWSEHPILKRCTIGKGPKYSSMKFTILNLRTGEGLSGPGLIVHLIRDHHFFQGKESPFRVDPEKAIEVLEIGQSQK